MSGGTTSKILFGDQEQVGWKVLTLAQYGPDVAPDIVFGGLAGKVTCNPYFGVVWAIVGGHIEWAMKKAVADTIIALELPKVLAKKIAAKEIKKIKQQENLTQDEMSKQIKEIDEKSANSPDIYLNELWGDMLELQTDSFADQILGGGTVKQIWYLSGKIVEYLHDEVKNYAIEQNKNVETLFNQKYVQDITIGAEKQKSILEEHDLSEELQKHKEIRLKGFDIGELMQMEQVKTVMHAAVGIVLRPGYKTHMPQVGAGLSKVGVFLINGMGNHLLTFVRSFADVVEDIQ